MPYKFSFSPDFSLDNAIFEFESDDLKATISPGCIALEAILVHNYKLTADDYEILDNSAQKCKIHIKNAASTILALDILLNGPNDLFHLSDTPDSLFRWRKILNCYIAEAVEGIKKEYTKIMPFIQNKLDNLYQEYQTIAEVEALGFCPIQNDLDDFLKHPLYQLLGFLMAHVKQKESDYTSIPFIDRRSDRKPETQFYQTIINSLSNLVPAGYDCETMHLQLKTPKLSPRMTAVRSAFM